MNRYISPMRCKTAVLQARAVIMPIPQWAGQTNKWEKPTWMFE